METRDKVEDSCKTTHESSPCQPRAGHSEMQAKEADDVRYYYFFNFFFFLHIQKLYKVCMFKLNHEKYCFLCTSLMLLTLGTTAK